MDKQAAKPAEAFNDQVVSLCEKVGRFVHRLIVQENLCWPEFPQAFLNAPPHEPLPSEDAADMLPQEAMEYPSPYFDVWWLGILGWLAGRIEEPAVCPDPRVAGVLQEAQLFVETPTGDLTLLLMWNPDVRWPLICEASVQALDYLSSIVQSANLESPDVDTPTKELSPRANKAHAAYELACQKMGLEEPTDRQVYEWLADKSELPGGYDIPVFGTWQRYVREARKHHSTQKNISRSGRTGRSIVNQDEL